MAIRRPGDPDAAIALAHGALDFESGRQVGDLIEPLPIAGMAAGGTTAIVAQPDCRKFGGASARPFDP
ncbi:MAG: hypothetical protein IPK59_01755 [Rhodospirillaceae bacterium]|nr:hypothetical protein [Rhodospirillaceae bacterium]